MANRKRYAKVFMLASYGSGPDIKHAHSFYRVPLQVAQKLQKQGFCRIQQEDPVLPAVEEVLGISHLTGEGEKETVIRRKGGVEKETNMVE